MFVMFMVVEGAGVPVMLTHTEILLSQMVICGEETVGNSKILTYNICTKT